MCTLRIVVSAVCFAQMAVSATAATKVFLLAGQSNMAGLGGYLGAPGYPADQPCPAPYNEPQYDVRFWDNGWVDLQLGFGHSSAKFGPEVSFGYALHNAIFPDDNIYLVKYGKSSTSLAVDWNPDGTGDHYTYFKNRVDAALYDICSDGLTPEIAGMIWMQGENDAIDSAHAASYEANLRNFIERVRIDFDAPDMRFVLGRILPYYDTTPPGGNAIVRAAQMAVPGQPGFENVVCFDTDELQLAYEGHYGTQGQIDLGILFGNQFIQTPEPSSMILVGTGLLALAGHLWRKRRLAHFG